MQETDDMALLEAYARRKSEGAFATLVGRHIHMVYSAALRQSGNPHLAEEITQATFIILARKAESLRRETFLAGWLLRTARFAAATELRTSRRRQRHEKEAHTETLIQQEGSAGPVWEQIAPCLDEAMARLSAPDRKALVLRFFEQKPFKEVGTALGVDEDSAQKRVSRALDKLRRIFVKRGMILSAAMIAGVLSANAVQAAPAGLIASVVTTAGWQGTAATSSTATLIKGTLKLMAWTKAKITAVAIVGVLLAAATATLTINKIEEHKADQTWRVVNFDSRVLDRVAPQVKILPAELPRAGSYGISNDKIMGTGTEADAIVRVAYQFWSRSRTILSTELPAGKFDFIASLPGGNAEALRQEIKRQFGVVARRETRQTNVLLLTVKFPNAQGLRPSKTRYGESQANGLDHFSSVNQPISSVAGLLESSLQIPVIDKTGLAQKFDIDLKWNRDDPQHRSLKQAVLDDLGLDLVPAFAPVEMLIIEKAG